MCLSSSRTVCLLFPYCNLYIPTYIVVETQYCITSRSDHGGRGRGEAMTESGGVFQPHVAVDVNNGEDDDVVGEAAADQLWATIERVASPQRRNLAIVVPDPGSSGSTAAGAAGGGCSSAEKKKSGEIVDVRRLDRHGAQRVLERALATADSDNAKLLHGLKARFDAYVMLANAAADPFLELFNPRFDLSYLNFLIIIHTHTLKTD